MHVFFYTLPGFVIWASSTILSLAFGAVALQTDGFIPFEIIFLWMLSSFGLTSVSICHISFWWEKTRPFFYLHINKKIVLLLVENPSSPAIIKADVHVKK